MQRRWVKVVLAVAVLLVLTVVLIPLFINANTFRPALEAQLSSALGRNVTLGNLSFSLFSGSLVAKDVRIADDPAFSTTPFLQAGSLHIGVVTSDLILRRQVHVTNFRADSPVVHLIHGQNGKWNFSSLSQKQKAGETAQQPGSVLPSTSIGEVMITNGTVSVSSGIPADSSQPAAESTLVYSKVNITVRPLDLAGTSPLELSASLPGDGLVKLSGKFGPLAQRDVADTPLSATLDLKHFDPVAAGVVQAGAGIAMVADVQAQLASDGSMLTSIGKVHAEHLQLARTGTPAPNPVDVDYTITDNLDARTGTVRDLAIKTGSVAAHVTGTYQLTAQAALLNLRLTAPNLPIDQLEALLPAFGVRLPSGSSLRGGALTANLAITGPATATHISGPVEVDNTQLTGFNLGSKIQGLAGGGGSANGGTEIQTMRAEVNTSPEETQLTNIYGLVPAIGSATGAGSISPGGALNFHLIAKLNSGTGIGAVAGAAMNAMGGIVGNIVHTAATNGVPLNITGTTSNPVIQADIGSMVKQQTGIAAAPGQQLNPGKVLQGLFGGH